jgi:two-component system nitrogen regulation response regulator NtrX
MKDVVSCHSLSVLNKFLEHMLPSIPADFASAYDLGRVLKEKLETLLASSGGSIIIRAISLCDDDKRGNFNYIASEDGVIVIYVPVSNSTKFLRIAVDCDPSNLSELSILSISLTLALKELMSEVKGSKKSDYIVGIPNDVVLKIKRAAASNLPILILGETGVGKEVVAEVIHKWSGRKGPFVVVNCSAIPHGLFENELFGHEPNSFTGSSKTGLQGKIELANGGTLFLDEIGEISLYSQAKLLRVIERGEFWKLGAVRPTKVDVKFVAATNRPLREFVNKGRFRKDLYYRLKGMEIVIPPLRERKELIEELVNAFLKDFSGGRVYFTGEAMRILKEYNWPGNVRELKYFVQYIVDEVKEGAVPLNKIKSALSLEKPVCPYLEAKRNFDRNYILSALEFNEWNITKTAQQLGMSRRWLQLKLKELRLRDANEFTTT